MAWKVRGYRRSVAGNDRFRPRPVTAFAALTLLIWTARVPLAWTNPDDTVGEKLIWSTPITFFVLAAAYLLVTQARGKALSGRTALLARTFAAVTVLYWAFRMVVILGGDRPAGFKAVHAVLAVVSAIAAVSAWRSLGEEPTPSALRGVVAGR